MELIHAILYGIVQGLTEFIPVSSSAHLRILPSIMGWSDPGTAFTAVIQLGTLLAVTVYFFDDLRRGISAWAKSILGKEKDNPDAKLGWAVFYGTIPIIVLGLALKDKIETTFRSLYIVGAALIILGIVMFLSERLAQGKRKVEDVQPKDGIIVGLWQALALIPGMSRSGSTISGALWAGFDRSSAARFSFLLSFPSILGSGLYELYKERKNLTGAMLTPTLVATVVSAVVGYAAIAFFMNFLKKRGIAPFVLYRIVLGAIIIFLVSSGRIPADAGADKKPATAAAHVSQKASHA
jgi:undecaprenyl-diphosphatase